LFATLIQPPSISVKDYEGKSNEIVVAGIVNIFSHSPHARGICFIKYLRNEDSKGYQSVLQRSCMVPTFYKKN
jgi:hypothetical protein